MKVRKREFTRLFSVVMAFLLLFSYGWPGVGQAQTNSETSVPVSLNKSQVQTKNKISKDLSKQFEKKDQVTFLLKMKDQVDTKKVAANAANKAQINSLSAAKTELKKRTAVVSALRAKSLDTQASVKQFLQKQKKAGKVKSFELFYIVNAMAVTGSKDVAQELAKFGEVEKILPNRTRHLITSNHGKEKKSSSKKKAASKTKAKTSDDDDDAVEPNVEHIGAPQVWDKGIDGTGVVVGSLDSGVQWDHPALKTKYRGYDPENSDQPNNEFNWFDARDGQDTPYDENGHGTHTTGTMVGSEADGSNQVGVAPGAQWIAARAFGGPLGRGTDVDILAAGEWLLAPKDAEGNPHPEKAPDIINNSWGGGAGLNEWFRPMVQNWRAAGIFPVFAAGNVSDGNPGGPGSVAVPANYPESFAVGATNNEDELAGFSLQGPSPYDEIKPEVVAPGVSIRSSVPDSSYDSIPGTSMAAPAVSGTVALMLQADASQTVDDIETILLNTAKPLTDAEFPESPNNGYGYGLVQAFEAVSAVTVGLGTIEGQVTKEGEDNEQPTYQHDKSDETYAGIEMPLQIAVQDNISIKNVTLQYRASEDENWQTIEAERVDGNYQEGVYKATIPGDSIAEPSITYRWQIKDFGGNDVTSDLYDVTVKSAISVGYSTDFESAPMGWISYGKNNTWEWGVPTSGPDEAFSGEKVYGTNLDGNYGRNNDATLMMPPVDLPEGESYLQFKQWRDLGSYASGSVLISTDRENWQQLAEFTDGSDWVDGEVRLSEYSGQRVYIAFNVISAFDWGKGWYLDDVALSDQPLHADPEPPTFDHNSLTQTYVGMDTPLQISVQDNISVEQVELQYHGADENEWTTVDTNLVDGDESDGTYQATIPQDAISQPSLTYRWHIVDYGGNTVTSDAYQVSVKEPVTVGYSTDFESNPGWLSYGTNNSWERGVPTSGPGHAVSGENVYATNLDGNYPGYSDSTLLMPTIQVPENGAFLQFKQWYKFDGFADGKVLVSTDQQNWDMLAQFEDLSYFWQYVEADLSDYAGQRIFVAFQLDNSSYKELGWYLDDVTVSDTSIFGTNQTNQEIQPNKQNKTALKKVKAEDTLKKADDIKEKGQTKAKKQSEKSGDPTSTLKLGEPKNVRSPVSTVNMDGKSKTNARVSSLPLGATVSVVETGQSMNTDPKNGSYSMTHSAGTYTLQADAYGFYSQTRSVEVPKDGTVEANFPLEPIPKGTMTGTVTNEATGEPVAGATLMLMEDPAVAPVTTDENGNYSITAYAGDYTLHVSAPEHYVKDVEITINGNDSTEKNVELKPFIGYPGEIGYDDGTAENATAFVDAGHGYAVKMLLPEGRDSAKVTGGKFLFADNDFPSPGGNEFQVEIWDASGKDGAPGKKLAGPIDATAIRDNTQWTKVDLNSAGVVVDSDFYMVYIQPKDDLESPGLSIDTSSPDTGRNWVLNGVTGKWFLKNNDGNYMIRALVSYEVTSPVITSPEDNTYTNEENMTIEGETASSTKVTVLNNGDEAATTQSTDDGTFSADITLNDGENVLKATASNDSGTTEPSEPVTVILDQDKPELMIKSPEDDWKTNDKAVKVEGTVTDDNLASVKVNGKAVNVNEDGSYSHRMLLEKGENVIRVTSTDKAGNEQSKQITVHAKFNELEISNLKPSEDKYLNTGESVRIEMDSEPGLDATFTIQRPLGNTLFAKISSMTELPMMEMEDGHYVGFWTVPSDWAAKEGEVRVMVRDDYGNESEKVADGKLLINVPNEKPEARFHLPRKVNPGESITFDGSNSMDPDGTIVKYEWDFGDGETTSGEAVEHSFSKRGRYRVTLTVTDNRGATDVKTQSVHVRGKRHHGGHHKKH